MTHSNSQTVHDGYRGFDMNIQYNLENDSRFVFCETYTQGSYEVFVMVNSVVSVLYVSRSWYNLSNQELLGPFILGRIVFPLYFSGYIYS